MTRTRRNLPEKYKREVAKKAIGLKEKSPYLTWVAIAERFNRIGSSRHLRSIIEKYYPDYFKKKDK